MSDNVQKKASPAGTTTTTSKDSQWFCSNTTHKDRKAAVYCKVCRNFYCEECESMGHKPCFVDHAAISVSVLNPACVSNFTGKCKVHPDYNMDYVCTSNYCLCCAECIKDAEHHGRCHTVSISTLNMDEIRQYTEKIAAEFSKLAERASNILEDIGSSMSTESEEIEKQRRLIQEMIDKHKYLLERKEEELVAETKAETEKGSYRATIETVEEELRKAKLFKDKLKTALEAWNRLDPREVLARVTTLYHSLMKLYETASHAFDVMGKRRRVRLHCKDEALKRTIKTYGEVKASVISDGPVLSVVGQATSHSVKLSWTAANFSVSAYRVLMSTSPEAQRKIVYQGVGTECVVDDLEAGQNYYFTMQVGAHGFWGRQSGVLIQIETKMRKRVDAWKKCPKAAECSRKYVVDDSSVQVATKANGSKWCTIVGSTVLQCNEAVSWTVRVLKSKDSDGDGICIGVAPFDINQNEDNYYRCGWYFHCYYSTLCSGPPHNFRGRGYGPRKGDGQYVHAGDSVGVVMDTTKGELSFVVNGVNFGVAYDGIPLDKPLVPCVLLYNEGDSIELDFSEPHTCKMEVITNNCSPSNVVANGATLDSIKLSWDAVEGASFYQIEVDRRKTLSASKVNEFTKEGLLPDTEHSFRVRAVCGSEVSEWSSTTIAKTQEGVPDFSKCAWKKCPCEKPKYAVAVANPRIATKVSDDDACCTIIGDTLIPQHSVTEWKVKVVETRDGDYRGICIGVAPSDINQSEVNNYDSCGWYLYLHHYTLFSGPPHNYRNKKYIKDTDDDDDDDEKEEEENEEQMDDDNKEEDDEDEDEDEDEGGDTMGVVMDTTKGELSFVLNGVNLGVAYIIPLDKPLVPCVLLKNKDDFVEMIL